MIKVYSDYAYEMCDVNEYIYELSKLLTKNNTVASSGKFSKRCYNVICAFDIETSRMYIGDKNPSIMYIWQFAFKAPGQEPKVLFGRTWDDFIQLLDMIKDVKGKSALKIFIHNTKFEFAYLYSRIANTKHFFKENRYPLYFESDGITFVDSLAYADNSLGTFTRNYSVPHAKADGDLDYTVFRDGTTPLTEQEYGYCYNDVAGLCEAIECDLTYYGDNLATMSLTHTGHIRRDFKRAYNNNRSLQKKVNSIKEDFESYQLSRVAYSGGYAHANFLWSNQTVTANKGAMIKSFDIASSYPFQMVSRKYPMGKWMYGLPKSTPRLIEKGFACRIHLVMYYVALKDPLNPFPALCKSKCMRGGTGVVEEDNGKVRYAEYYETVMTDIDYKRICKQYEFEPEFIEVAYTKYDYLPKEYRDVILKYFGNKTKYKADLKACTDDKLKNDIESNLNNSKHLLNGGYGCIGTDPLKATIEFENGEYTKTKPTEDDYNKAIKKACLHFPWAAWVTAWARDQWHDMSAGLTDLGATVLYGDTDSVKVYIPAELIDTADNYITTTNAKLQSIAEQAGGYCDYNGKRVYMGVWDDEGYYIKFRALRAKSYLGDFTKYGGKAKLKLTCAGVNSRKGTEWLSKQKDPYSTYTWGLVFPASVATTNTEYGDDKNYTVTYKGKEYHVGTYVTIVESERTIRPVDSYLKLTEYGQMILRGIKTYD